MSLSYPKEIVLARQVPLIVMDEPLSGLDPLVRDSIIHSVISYLDMEKQTLVISTHEVREITSIGSHNVD